MPNICRCPSNDGIKNKLYCPGVVDVPAGDKNYCRCPPNDGIKNYLFCPGPDVIIIIPPAEEPPPIIMGGGSARRRRREKERVKKLDLRKQILREDDELMQIAVEIVRSGILE